MSDAVYTMLDCFCGLGGASNGFHEAGFSVKGIEINPRIAKLYPYEVVTADIRALDGKDFRGYDVIWGSPPCVHFSTASLANKTRVGRTPPDPIKGLELVNVFRKFVDDAKPGIWLMENVRRLEKFYLEEPTLRFRISKLGYRTLWGNIDFPLFPDFFSSRNMQTDFGKLNWWEASMRRARIPTPISRAIAEVCLSKLKARCSK